MKDDNQGRDFFFKHKGALEMRLPDVLNPILIKLQEKKVLLNNLEREQVQTMPTSGERNYKLITMIEKRGARAQQVFYEVLKDVDPWLVEDLEC